MAKVSIVGLDELVGNLRALPKELVGKNGGPIRAGLAACAKVVRDEARQRAPYNEAGYGKHLRDEIIMKRDPNPRATNDAAERYLVTVRYKDKKYANNRRNRRKGLVGSKYQNFGDFYYWKFLEFGHHTGKRDKKSDFGRKGGGGGTWVQHAFMRPAFEATKTRLTDIFIAKCSDGIAKIVRAMKK